MNRRRGGDRGNKFLVTGLANASRRHNSQLRRACLLHVFEDLCTPPTHIIALETQNKQERSLLLDI